jgi:hypothetical protein
MKEAHMRDRPNDNHRNAVPGGPPGKGKIVHHKDENKENNASGNLASEDRGAHTAHHKSGAGRRLTKLKRALTMEARREKIY